MRIKTMRGDLSAPVLAIIVTIGIIAAGLVLLAWFWWFAPQAGKTGALQILGQPALVCTKKDQTEYVTVLLNVKNSGTETIEVKQILAGELTFNIEQEVGVGQSVGISRETTGTCPTTYTVDGVILTTAGTYSTSFTVVKSPSPPSTE